MTTLVLMLLLAADGEKVQAIIWAGGATQEAGQTAMKQWEARKDDVRDLLKLDPAFPRLEKSDDIAGMKPGFWVVVLGYCIESEAKAALAYLKGFEPNIYGRDVALSAKACPKAEPKWRVSVVEAKLGDGQVLAAGLYDQGEGGNKARLLLSLRGKDKQVLASARYQEDDCTVGKLTVTAGAVVLPVECVIPRCDEGDWFKGVERHSVDNGKIVMNRGGKDIKNCP